MPELSPTAPGQPTPDAPGETTATRAKTRGFQPLRDIPTLIWLVLIVVAAAAHRQLPLPGWLLLHLLFLGAITHSILVWSQHFSFALTRTEHTTTDRRAQNIRLTLANAGIALVLFGVPTAVWALTAIGTGLIIVSVVWHGASLFRRLRRALPGRFARTVRYYVVSAVCLPIGAGIGAWIAGPGDSEGRLVLAHAIINVLGWVGITVAGTLVTLWPTMLRTRADDHAMRHALIALPVLGGGVLVAAIGAVLGVLALATLGLAAYAAGLAILAVSLVRTARAAPPHSFATLSAGAALLWWSGGIAVLTVATALAWSEGTGFAPVRRAVNDIAPYFAAGFAAQVLIGALSYLAPVAIGGGPAPVRTGTAVLDRFGPFRVATANVALLVCALPVSSVMRVAASLIYLVAMASFLPLFIIALRRQGRAKRESAQSDLPHSPPADRIADTGRATVTTRSATETETSGRRAGQSLAGLLIVSLVAVGFAATDAESVGQFARPLLAAGAEANADAPVQTVEVSAADMRFTPNRIEVPAGTRLVIELTNSDETQVHDLVLENGVRSTRLAPGDHATIDAGVITADMSGWCSIVGHRQMGMTLEIVATGSGAEAGQAGQDHPFAHGTDSSGGSAADLIDLMAAPGDDFTPYDAALPALPPSNGPVTHRIELPVTEQVHEVAPRVQQRLWTFGKSAPGPILHGRVGDTFEITLINDGTIGHSIDFHAGALAPDEPMRTIQPGETLTYTFTATRAGIWMYHCSTMPMSAHIANGMAGAVIIEPADLPAVDHSYVLVQSEYYLGPQDGEVDVERIATGVPDLVTFNGYAAQYDHAPLTARVGDRVRFWVLDVGPNRATSFHVVGGQFDTVWSEGRYLLNRANDTGSQALALQPAQGGFVELVMPEAGHYPFVSHIMSDAERGAHGVLRVTD